MGRLVLQAAEENLGKERGKGEVGSETWRGISVESDETYERNGSNFNQGCNGNPF